ncbi:MULTISPECIES: carbohydrate ABC transporter permease [unclassified Streptomyces]|uniref:carbohydrate ABC transporter permease n=1 Tax=unclassified Streptomyces TaxID=2593676 RepID=UPI00081E630E|nr:sugar ABC transporter permease [Streptomyces sp. Ncost-T10-10d]SCF95771.1 carbohydrate ABC transporter membrane protein 1, CUT1 family [Streptomyces sp. Ncost-T10-10d]
MARCPFGTQRTRRFIPWASIAIPGAGWLLFGLYPSLATIGYSFTRYSGLPGTPLNVCGLCNYSAAFTSLSSVVGDAVRVTLIYVVGVTVLQTAVGLGLALLLNRPGRSYTVYRAIIFMPQIFSVAVVGAIFSLMFDPYSGPAEKVVQGIFGSTTAFLGSTSLALPLVILVNVWMFSGYTMLIYIAGLRNIPPAVYEAAAMDGAGRLRVFRHVTWPLLAPATTVTVFLTAMGTLGEYALIMVLTGGNFGTKTLGLYMFQSAFGGDSQLGYGSMLAMLQFFLTMVIGAGLLFTLRRREVSL